MYGNEKIDLKVLRVFASKRALDYPIMKMKFDNRLEKISYTPDKVFIDNSRIIDKDIPENLDKSWYISLAKERLGSFVPENTITLFDLLDTKM